MLFILASISCTLQLWKQDLIFITKPIAERTKNRMNRYSRKAKLFALLSLLVVLLLSGLAACGEQANALPSTTQSSAQQNSTSTQPGAPTVVTKYLQLFNAGMKSGDFAALASVYAPDATLTQSNPKGVTTVIHGL